MSSSVSMPTVPFQLSPEIFGALPRTLGAALASSVERLLGLASLNALYATVVAKRDGATFCDRALASLGIRVNVSSEDLARVPAQGPLVVVANHPYGGLDGIVLLSLVQRIRPDVRIFANHLLRPIPEMHESCFFVDPFGGLEARRRNLASTKAAIRWVREGGTLAVFPAGEVAHRTWNERCVTDPPWNPSIARILRDTGAPAVPVYFNGHNRRRFQWAGMLHPRLRTAMLPREFLCKRGHNVHVGVGSVIPHARLLGIAGDSETPATGPAATDQRVTDYLRLRTFILQGRTGGGPSPATECSERTRRPLRTDRPLVEAVPPETLSMEVDALSEGQMLAESGTLRAVYASSAQIPFSLREIGRLREATFRLVGEGTGREIDLDRFDEHYLHLFVWNRETKQIVGAYRMGRTDELLARFGARGLYTTTLFSYHPRLLRQLDPALELGRSFVVPEYQRDYAPLMLLWKGIGRFVVLNPRYRRLFGVVSISDNFHSMTKALLMAFLKAHKFDHASAALVRPLHPPHIRRFEEADVRRAGASVNDLSEVEELVREIEANGRGIPVLLRQYLKLNGRLLGFNVDPDFGNVLDGLVLVDLANVERPVLNRYMGKEGAEVFLAHHAETRSATASPLTMA